MLERALPSHSEIIAYSAFGHNFFAISIGLTWKLSSTGRVSKPGLKKLVCANESSSHFLVVVFWILLDSKSAGLILCRICNYSLASISTSSFHSLGTDITQGSFQTTSYSIICNFISLTSNEGLECSPIRPTIYDNIRMMPTFSFFTTCSSVGCLLQFFHLSYIPWLHMWTWRLLDAPIPVLFETFSS